MVEGVELRSVFLSTLNGIAALPKRYNPRFEFGVATSAVQVCVCVCVCVCEKRKKEKERISKNMCTDEISPRTPQTWGRSAALVILQNTKVNIRNRIRQLEIEQERKGLHRAAEAIYSFAREVEQARFAPPQIFGGHRCICCWAT